MLPEVLLAVKVVVCPLVKTTAVWLRENVPEDVRLGHVAWAERGPFRPLVETETTLLDAMPRAEELMSVEN